MPARCAKSMNRTTSRTKGAARIESEQRKLTLICIRRPSPPKEVYVVPALLVIPPGRVVVDPNLVISVGIQLWVHVGLQDVFQDSQFGLLFGLEVFRVVEDLTVPVPQYVGGEPPVHSEHPGLEHWRKCCLHQGLSRLEVLAAYGHTLIQGKAFQGWDVCRKVGGPICERDTFHQCCVGVDHGRRYAPFPIMQTANEALDVPVNLRFPNEFFGRSAPDHHQPVTMVFLLETSDILPNSLYGGKRGASHLCVAPVDPSHVLAIENGRHGFYCSQEVRYGLQVFVAV